MDDLEQQRPDVGDFQTNVDHLRSEVERLEQLLKESNEAARGRIMQAQLSTAAIRAGMVDLDGLKLFDFSEAKANEWGEVEGVDRIMAEMKQQKPWLFRGASSSSRANPPPAQPVRTKLASEMTADEYRIARAELLRRR
jgi:hypothetical protein